MNCPHCGHDKTVVAETRPNGTETLRYRRCTKCGRRFTTMERVCVAGPAGIGYMDLTAAPPAPPVLAAVPEPPAEKPAAKRVNNRRWHPVGVPDGICREAAPLLLEWWNESRRLKHKGKAVWSEKAWLASVERVAALPPQMQVALCQAGVENGWQALKAEYINNGGQPVSAQGRPMPRDPAMLAALDSWPA